MTIGVTAKLTVREGAAEEFERIFTRMVSAVNENEEGCSFYQCFKLPGQANTYMVLEQYRDQAAVEAHQASAHFKAIGAELGAVMAAPAEVTAMESI